jgi:hypothetical protein
MRVPVRRATIDLCALAHGIVFGYERATVRTGQHVTLVVGNRLSLGRLSFAPAFPQAIQHCAEHHQ